MCMICLHCCPQVGKGNHNCGLCYNAVDFVGTLILSVDKDTYEELGLQGKRSTYQQHRYSEFMTIVCSQRY